MALGGNANDPNRLDCKSVRFICFSMKTASSGATGGRPFGFDGVDAESKEKLEDRCRIACIRVGVGFGGERRLLDPDTTDSLTDDARVDDEPEVAASLN